MNNPNSNMDVSVQHLKDETGKEGLHRKKENEALGKMVTKLYVKE